MGGGSWDSTKYRSYSTTVSHKTTEEIYTSRSMSKLLDPKNVKYREARDSTDHPESNAINVNLDMTGSMSPVLGYMAKKGLGTLVEELLDRKPVKDPQIMIGMLDDVEVQDTGAFQVTQFESDNRLVEQLALFHLTNNGGGNSYESYTLPYYFAAMHTSIDCWEKRKKKGYLFTIGDEEVTKILRASDIKRVLGKDEEIHEDLSPRALLDMAERTYNVYHVMVAEGSHARFAPDRVKKSWRELMGQNALWLQDHTKLAELVVSTIQINEGADAKEVIDSWKGDTSVVIRNAGISDLVATAKGTATKGGVVRI